MAVSDVDIANLALSKLGQQPITSFADNTTRSSVIARNYRLLCDKLQRKRWNFNRKYTTLAATNVIPPFEYAYAYPLPDDYIRVELFGQAAQAQQAPPPQIPPAPYSPPSPTTFSAGPTDFGTGMPGVSLADYNNSRTQDYRIVGKEIWSNQYPPGYLIYGARVVDPNMFDSYFIEAFATYLAFELCEAVTNSNTKKAALRDEYREELFEALTAKAIELPPEQIPDDTWMLSRIME